MPPQVGAPSQKTAVIPKERPSPGGSPGKRCFPGCREGEGGAARQGAAPRCAAACRLRRAFGALDCRLRSYRRRCRRVKRTEDSDLAE